MKSKEKCERGIYALAPRLRGGVWVGAKRWRWRLKKNAFRRWRWCFGVRRSVVDISLIMRRAIMPCRWTLSAIVFSITMCPPFSDAFSSENLRNSHGLPSRPASVRGIVGRYWVFAWRVVGSGWRGEALVMGVLVVNWWFRW